jgi:hypothetical protein
MATCRGNAQCITPSVRDLRIDELKERLNK